MSSERLTWVGARRRRPFVVCRQRHVGTSACASQLCLVYGFSFVRLVVIVLESPFSPLLGYCICRDVGSNAVLHGRFYEASGFVIGRGQTAVA